MTKLIDEAKKFDSNKIKSDLDLISSLMDDEGYDNVQDALKYIKQLEKQSEWVSVESLINKTFIDSENKDFNKFVSMMPSSHWAKYDLSAVRLGFEAARLLLNIEQLQAQLNEAETKNAELVKKVEFLDNMFRSIRLHVSINAEPDKAFILEIAQEALKQSEDS